MRLMSIDDLRRKGKLYKGGTYKTNVWFNKSELAEVMGIRGRIVSQKRRPRTSDRRNGKVSKNCSF